MDLTAGSADTITMDVLSSDPLTTPDIEVSVVDVANNIAWYVFSVTNAGLLEVSLADVLNAASVDFTNLDSIALQLTGGPALKIDYISTVQGQAMVSVPTTLALISLGVAGIGFRQYRQLKAA